MVALGLAGFAGTFILTYMLIGTSAIDYRVGSCCPPCRRRPSSRGGVRARRGDRPDPLAPTPGVDRHHLLWGLPGTTRSSSTSTPPGPASWLPADPLRFACTFALAAASYYLVERPVMYGTFWRSFKAIVPATALLVATVVVVVAGTAVPATASPARSAESSLPGAERQSLLQASAFTLAPCPFPPPGRLDCLYPAGSGWP